MSLDKSPRAVGSCSMSKRCTAIRSTAIPSARWSPRWKKLTGIAAVRVHVEKGYRGHNHPNQFKVWITGQVRRVTPTIKREMKRRAAVEPVIGHLKADHRMDRNHLKGRSGDAINALMAAVGYNFSLLLRWFAAFLRAFFNALLSAEPGPACHPAAAA